MAFAGTLGRFDVSIDRCGKMFRRLQRMFAEASLSLPRRNLPGMAKGVRQMTNRLNLDPPIPMAGDPLTVFDELDRIKNILGEMEGMDEAMTMRVMNYLANRLVKSKRLLWLT
jgi:hypothetical protein